MAIGGFLGIALSQPLSAREFVAEAIPADVAAKAVGPLAGVQIKACTDRQVTARGDIRDLASAAEFFALAGLPVNLNGSLLEVGCDQTDAVFPAPFAATNVPSGSPLEPFAGHQGSYAPAAGGYSGGGAYRTQEPPVSRVVDAKWVKRPLLEKLAGALGLKMVFDETPEHPVLLSGPADAVADARAYIDAINVCPSGLRMEASIIQRSDISGEASNAGIRIGTRKIGFGTDGSADTGLQFSWLTAFLEANREISHYRVNASHSALLLPGEAVVLRNGGETPVRSGTSLTDRETRTEVVYRTTGFNLDLTLLAIDGDDALIAVDQSYSSVGSSTELGPRFNTRAFKSVVRVPIGETSLLTVSGDDTYSDQKRRGLLFRGKAVDISKQGSFLVFKLVRSPCRERELASATGKAKPDKL